MTLNLEPGTAEACVTACGRFLAEVRSLARGERYSDFDSGGGSFPTARQLGSVYSLFASEDLQKLLNGFAHQAEAMSMLFAAAGGLIDSQDEAVAAALGKASASVDGLQSLGLLLPSVVAMVNPAVGLMLEATDADASVGDYQRVGHEEVADAPLDWMVSGAQALSPAEFAAIGTKAAEVAEGLRSAGDALNGGLKDQLSGPWQGDFATQALASMTPFVTSVTGLADTLDEVGRRAIGVENGFNATQRQMADTAANYEAARASATARDSGADMAALLAPPTDSAQEIARSKAAAEQQARAIINVEYSPVVMDANLTDLDIPMPYRVVSGSALGGPTGIDLVSAWNVDGVIQPATAATPSAAALAAASGGGAGADLGVSGGGASGGAGMGATTTSPPTTPTDAGTEQALLASRAGAADGAGAVAGPAGQAGSGAGVNASTTAAGAPFAPATAGQQSGAGAGGIRGIRGAGNPGRDRDRGFGSAAGLVGGGGAAAAGAAASRLGGAGTLAGIGGGAGLSGGAGVSGGGAGAGAFGAGSAGAGAAGSGAGAVSSSSSGGAQAGRAGAMPMGAMAGAAGAGQNSDRKDHTPAGYLTNATNTTAIIGEPLKVSPAVLGRKPVVDPSAHEAAPEPFRGRVIGRDYTGRGAR